MPLPHEAPNDRLAKELKAVAEDAVLLANYLRGENTLDEKFPKQQLTDIAETLIRLPNGTAAGALEVLSYAARRLPAIRREFLALDEGEAALSREQPPPQMRGMGLDKFLKELIASVGTALDECREQEGAEQNVTDEIDIRVRHNGRDPEIKSAERAARKLTVAADQAVSGLKDIALPASKRSDEFGRNLSDVTELGRMAAAELSFKTTVLNWVRQIGSFLNRYPELIVRLGNSIQIGSDLGKATYLRWEDFKHKILHLLADEIKQVGGDLEALGKRLQSAREGSSKGSIEIERRVLMEKVGLATHSKPARLKALEELTEKFPEHHDTALLLAERIRNDPANAIRKYCARALRSLPSDVEVAEELIERLLAAYDKYPRTEVGAAVVEILSKNEFVTAGGRIVRDFLTDVVLESRDSDKTMASLRALISVYSDQTWARDLSRTVIKTYPDANVQSAALAGLINHACLSEEVRDSVVWALNQVDNASLRVQAAEAVAKYGRRWPWAQSVIDRMQVERNFRLRSALAKAKTAFEDDGDGGRKTARRK